MRIRLAPGARRYALPPFVLGVLTAVAWPPVALGLLSVGCFVVWFFRDPERYPPPEEGVVAPADGRISVVRTEGDRVRVGVFMGPMDVHVVRTPLDGRIADIEHRAGAHRPAFSKESENNERVEIAFEDASTEGYAESGDGGEPSRSAFDVTLIAGAFARRISPYVDSGTEVSRGERLGHIAFGSRTDVLLPVRYGPQDIRVESGDTVRAGETVLAD